MGGPKRYGASGPLLFALGCVPGPCCAFGVLGVVCVPSGVPGTVRPGRGAGLGVPEPRRFGPPCCLARCGLRVRSAMSLCTDQSCPPVTNVARNSPPHISNFEIRPLELQRLWAISKNDRVKLRATFAGTVTAVTLGPLYRPREPRPGLATTNSFTKNRNHHEDLQSAAPRPHGPLQNASPRPSGARRTGGGGFAALGAGCRRVVGVSWF